MSKKIECTDCTVHFQRTFADRDIKSYHPDAHELLLDEDSSATERDVTLAQMTYLFHPYLIANCGAKTTTVFSNLMLITFLLATSHKKRVLACLMLAISTMQQVRN